MPEADTTEQRKQESTLNDLLSVSPPDVKCQGIIYKADVQHCRTERGILFSIRLNEVKRMSCKGCKKCSGGTKDQLSEISATDWPILDIAKVKHGKLYTIEFCNISTDLETGYADSWDLRAVEYSG